MRNREVEDGGGHDCLAEHPGEAYVHRQAMLTARRLVEDHIRDYGMVPHPDKLKERIAREIASAAIGP